MRADRIGTRKQFLDFLRSRVGGDVDVFRREIAYHVADAATGKEGDMVVFAQFCRDVACCFFHCLHKATVAAPLCRGELESKATERSSYGCRATVPGYQLGIGRRERLPYNFVSALSTLDSGFCRKV